MANFITTSITITAASHLRATESTMMKRSFSQRIKDKVARIARKTIRRRTTEPRLLARQGSHSSSTEEANSPVPNLDKRYDAQGSSESPAGVPPACVEDNDKSKKGSVTMSATAQQPQNHQIENPQPRQRRRPSAGVVGKSSLSEATLTIKPEGPSPTHSGAPESCSRDTKNGVRLMFAMPNLPNTGRIAGTATIPSWSLASGSGKRYPVYVPKKHKSDPQALSPSVAVVQRRAQRITGRAGSMLDVDQPSAKSHQNSFPENDVKVKIMQRNRRLLADPMPSLIRGRNETVAWWEKTESPKIFTSTQSRGKAIAELDSYTLHASSELGSGYEADVFDLMDVDNSDSTVPSSPPSPGITPLAGELAIPQIDSVSTAFAKRALVTMASTTLDHFASAEAAGHHLNGVIRQNDLIAPHTSEIFTQICLCDPKLRGNPIFRRSKDFKLSATGLEVGPCGFVNLPMAENNPGIRLEFGTSLDRRPSFYVETWTPILSISAGVSEQIFTLASRVDVTDVVRRLAVQEHWSRHVGKPEALNFTSDDWTEQADIESTLFDQERFDGDLPLLDVYPKVEENLSSRHIQRLLAFFHSVELRHADACLITPDPRQNVMDYTIAACSPLLHAPSLHQNLNWWPREQILKDETVALMEEGDAFVVSRGLRWGQEEIERRGYFVPVTDGRQQGRRGRWWIVFFTDPDDTVLWRVLNRRGEELGDSAAFRSGLI